MDVLTRFSWQRFSVLIEWNRLLFNEFIPTAWAKMLPILTKNDHLTDVFSLWPIIDVGSSLHWRTLPISLLRQVDSMNLAIWPTFGHQTAFDVLSSVLVAFDIEDRVLLALTEAGLKITSPPNHILEIIHMTEPHYTPLSPKMAHTALLVPFIPVVSDVVLTSSLCRSLRANWLYCSSTRRLWIMFSFIFSRLRISITSSIYLSFGLVMGVMRPSNPLALWPT
jgi:hypothetical protein